MPGQVRSRPCSGRGRSRRRCSWFGSRYVPSTLEWRALAPRPLLPGFRTCDGDRESASWRARRSCRLHESLAEFGRLVDRSERRVGKDKVVITLELALLEMTCKLLEEARGEWNRPARARCLHRAESSTRMTSANANETRLPVDVLSTKSDQFTAAQSRQRGRQVQGSIGRPPGVVRHRHT